MGSPGLTASGYEIQFGTNHVGHALFTQLLLPKMLETAKQAGSDVRIVVLSSDGHKLFGSKLGIPYDACKTDMASYYSMQRYGLSKLANVYFAKEMARRYPSIKTVAVHPGGLPLGYILEYAG